ncbi:MAG: DUF2071 domain-containing protein [Acidobacteriota bacterium]
MTTGKQIQLVMREMLFINWAVSPEVVRKRVDERLELDTKTDSTGQAVAFVSAVCFRVAELRSSVLPLPGLSFEQVNYRAYVRAGEVPAVCFLDMKVNSRMITALTSFMSVPVHYEDIDIGTSRGETGLLRYEIKSAGLRAEAIVGEQPASAGVDWEIAPDFITERFVGYAGAGNVVFKIEFEQPGLDAVRAHVQNVEAASLQRLGLLSPDESAQPHSAFYVREALFGANTPTRIG